MTDENITILDDEAERWLNAPAGCCECGTGGPYDETPRGAQVTRYVYGDADRYETYCDWHESDDVAAVDYGADVVVTTRQVEADLGGAA